jgi:hypothetical protein
LPNVSPNLQLWLAAANDITRVVWDVDDVVQFDGWLAVESWPGDLRRFDSEFDGADAQHGQGSAGRVS